MAGAVSGGFCPLGGSSCALILGDNIFYGAGLVRSVTQAANRTDGATVFAYYVPDPERYGVAEVLRDGRVVVPSVSRKGLATLPVSR